MRTPNEIMQKLFLAAAITASLVLLATAWQKAGAATQYAAGSLLQPNDVTSSHIRDNTIVDVDVNSNAQLSATKISPRGTQATVLLTDGTNIATTTALKFATSSADLYVFGGRIHATSTNFNSVNYTWPSADGTANQNLTTNGSGTLSWQSPISSVVEATMTSGEAITAGNAVFVATSTNNRTQDIATTGTNAKSFGQSTGIQMLAQSFTETTHTGKISLWLKIIATPTDAVKVSIQADSAGAPSGTDIMSGTIAAAALTGTFTQYTVTLSDIQPTNTATTYWVVISRSGAFDDVNYYQLYGDGANTYAGGTIAYYQPSTWTNQAEDARISLVDNFTMGRVYKTSSKYNNYSLNFVGYAKTTVASSTSVSVGVAGVATGLSGLVANTWYYLSDTLGAVATSAGTIAKDAGVGITTTTMLVKNGW